MPISGAPNGAPDTEPGREPATPTSPNAKIEPRIPPAPTAALRTPRPSCGPSRSIATTTANTVSSRRERLHGPEPGHQHEPPVGRDRGEPAQDLPRAPAAPCLRAGVVDSRTTTRPPIRDATAQAANTAAGPLTASRTAATTAAAERRRGVERAAHGVRARQLRRRAERGQPGRSARRRTAPARPWRRSPGRRSRRRPRPRPQRRRPEGRGAAEPIAAEHPLAPDPVGHRGDRRTRSAAAAIRAAVTPPTAVTPAPTGTRDRRGRPRTRSSARPRRAERGLLSRRGPLAISLPDERIKPRSFPGPHGARRNYRTPASYASRARAAPGEAWNSRLPGDTTPDVQRRGSCHAASEGPADTLALGDTEVTRIGLGTDRLTTTPEHAYVHPGRRSPPA